MTLPRNGLSGLETSAVANVWRSSMAESAAALRKTAPRPPVSERRPRPARAPRKPCPRREEDGGRALCVRVWHPAEPWAAPARQAALRLRE